MKECTVKNGISSRQIQLSINIELLAYNIIRVTEHRLAVISGSSGIEYDNVMTFRKK